MQNYEGLYISSGEGNQMFTLRNSWKEYTRDSFYFRDLHVKNLSIDLEIAKKKANEYAGYDVPVFVSDNLEDINRRSATDISPDIIRNGWHKGKSIYLLSDHELSEQQHNLHKMPKKLAKLYFAEMNERMLYFGYTEEEIMNQVGSGNLRKRVLYLGKQILDKIRNKNRLAEQLKAREERLARQEFVGNIGDRITLDLELEFEKSGRSQWGGWYLYNFIDENGNKFVYMGSTILYVYKGDKVKVTGTIKSHDVYNGEKQTKLQRIKVQEVLERA